MDKKTAAILTTSALFIFFVICGVGLFIYSNLDDDFRLPGGNDPIVVNNDTNIKKFASEKEFKEFLLESEGIEDFYGGQRAPLQDGLITDELLPEFEDMGASSSLERNIATKDPSRHSVTNTQVLSIDEADVVKTDGKYIYYSTTSDNYYNCNPGTIRPNRDGLPEPAFEEKLYYPQPVDCDYSTSIIGAFPIETLEKIEEIDDYGNLYLSEDILIIEEQDGYVAYDVKDKENPRKIWANKFEGFFNSSREYNGDLYLVTNTYVRSDTPCPIPLLETEGMGKLTLQCTDIYYPSNNNRNDNVYTVTKIDMESGEVKDTLSFLGNASRTILYMSENNVYITYPDNPDEFSIFYDFIQQNKDLFSDTFVAKVDRLSNYEITQSSKMNELYSLTDDYFRSMDDDDAMKNEKDILNQFNKYRDKNIRVFSGTGIIVVDNQNLEIKSKGKVQGYINDQFSMDEYNGMLRVTTTVDPYSSGYYLFDRYTSTGEEVVDVFFTDPIDETQNDLVIFDEDLNVMGEVRGMGVTEQIYATRFVNDLAYVVTFRQTDPFYVIDLSDPREPLVKGELKIPGYSSYLHPLSSNLILGIGEEDFRVKISLFDVTNPQRPLELSKYSIGEHWSEVEETHHAFLHDPEHKVFFLPASDGGYVLSYENDELTLVKTVSGYDVERAIYIDDYLYIISQSEIVVFDENTWKKVAELSID